MTSHKTTQAEVPEIFQLDALEKRKTRVKIRKRGPAPFILRSTEEAANEYPGMKVTAHRLVDPVLPLPPCAICGEPGADIPFRVRVDGKWGSHDICSLCFARLNRKSARATLRMVRIVRRLLQVRNE